MITATLERIETFVNSKTFWFKPDKSLQYVAGQFTELYLPHDHPDDRGIRRWFTFSSSPSEPLLAITTRFSTPGSTFKKELATLTPGSSVRLAEPMGDFVLPKDASIPLVFVASGIGVTPVRSMLKFLADTNETRNVAILYDAHTVEDLIFSPLFIQYGASYKPFIHHTSEGYSGSTSRIAATDILSAAHDPRSLIFLSGPEQLVERLGAELEKCGVRKHRIIVDYFSGYPAA